MQVYCYLAQLIIEFGFLCSYFLHYELCLFVVILQFLQIIMTVDLIDDGH
jgi:hypothetical protein